MGAIKVFGIAEPVILVVSLFYKQKIVLAKSFFDNSNPQNGRILKCSIKTESAIYHISNRYANNSGVERKRLFESFHNFFGNFTDDSVDHYNILVGDFNCTLDKTIDRNPSHNRDDIGTN